MESSSVAQPAGHRPSTKKRPPPSISSTTTSSSDVPARPPKRVKRGDRPVHNVHVKQAVFGAVKSTNLKQSIRSARRLLSKEGLDAEVKRRKELEVKILTDQLAEKQKHDRVAKVEKKYKMIKFIGQAGTCRTASALPHRPRPSPLH